MDNATLTRFFSLHFVLPFVRAALVLLHLIYLHETGSSNPLGVSRDIWKVSFHRYFRFKDLLGFAIFFLVLGIFVFEAPWSLGDPENFIMANPLVTPAHIQPEWYFLFAYAILRAIPNKLGGVLALLARVLILGILPFLPKAKFRGLAFYPAGQRNFWALVAVFVLLTWAGSCPVEEPYILLSQRLRGVYFGLFFFITFSNKILDYILRPKRAPSITDKMLRLANALVLWAKTNFQKFAGRLN